MSSHRSTNSINEQINYFNYKQPQLARQDTSSTGGTSTPPELYPPPQQVTTPGNYTNRPASIYSNVTSPAMSVYSPGSDLENDIKNLSLNNEYDDSDYDNDKQYLERSKIILPATDPKSPYHISLPYLTTRPTEELGKRFAIWKKIIKQLIFYFKELSMLRQHYYQLNMHMLQNIQFLSLNNKNNPKKTFGSNNNNNSSGGGNGNGNGVSALIASPNSNSNINNNNGAISPDGKLSPQESSTNDIFFGTSEDKFINSSFLPTTSKSVQSLSTTLFNYHKSLSERELQTYNELTLKIIPRLENLKKSLNFKIKEIMNLKNDFKFLRLRSEVAKTGQILNSYINSVEFLEKGFVNGSGNESFKVTGKHDPYLLKIQLDLQLKRQLLEENYFKEAFNNLQNSGLELEKIIYKELQTAMTKFSNSIQQEMNSVRQALIDDLNCNFLMNDTSIDWNYYMHNDNGKHFLNTEAKKQFRKLSDIVYPYQKTLMSSSLRSDYMSKKNKVTKTYSKFYYVLTANYLHEFKTNDRQKEQIPLQSLNLNKCTLLEHQGQKLILQYINKEKNKVNFVFKCSELKEASKWANDLMELTSFRDSIERNKYLVETKFQNYNYAASSTSSSSTQSSRSVSANHSPSPVPNNTSSNSSLNIKFLPRHRKTQSQTSLKQQTQQHQAQQVQNQYQYQQPPVSSLRKQTSSSSLSKLTPVVPPPAPAAAPADTDDPGKFTTHMNLSSNNLIPSINITDHSPSTDSGSGTGTAPGTGTAAGPGTDYFNVKPVTPQHQQQQAQQQQQQQPLTLNLDRKLPFNRSYSGNSMNSRTSPPNSATKPNFKINLPSPSNMNMNQMMMMNNIKTPGELPSSSIGDIIHGFHHSTTNQDNNNNENFQ